MTTPDALEIPGGAERLLRVGGVRVPIDRARTLLVLVRSLHSAPPPQSGPGRAGVIADYLVTVARVRDAAARLVATSASQAPPAAVHDRLESFVTACGLAVGVADVVASSDPKLAAQRQILLDAGFPVEEWRSWLNSYGRPAGALDKLKVVIPADHVPALLPADVWARSVFGRANAAEELAAAILGDRRAALLYYGLFSLDDETLAWFVRHPSVVKAVHRNAAAAFAAFSDGLAIRSDRVALPGGAPAVVLWEDLVGARVSDAEAFVTKLFASDAGRLAWLFDAVAHLDAAHQAFALGQSLADAAARREQLRSLSAAFASFDRGWVIRDRPFTRMPVDATFVLGQVTVGAEGRMAPPAESRLWQRVFAPPRSPEEISTGSPDPATAAWIVGQVTSGGPVVRRARLDAVLFAQRLLVRNEGAPAASSDALSSVLAAFAGHEALMVTLEAMGFADPADYAKGAAAADGLASADPFRTSLRLAQFQGALALLRRLHDVGALDGRAVRSLARSLFEQQPSEDGFARWVEQVLHGALPRRPQGMSSSAEDQLIDALAGVAVERPVPTVQWEDHLYRVDVAGGERLRLRRIRAKQGGDDLDTVFDLRRAAVRLLSASSSAAAGTEAASLRERLQRVDLLRNDSLFGVPVVPSLQVVLEGVQAFVANPVDAGARTTARRRLGEVVELVLAEVLASHTYALAIGDPEDSLLLAADPARRHEFGAGGRPDRGGPWSLADEARDGAVWVVRGSLLGLERALARTWVRALSVEPPAVGHGMDQVTALGIAEGVACLNPLLLADRTRDLLAAGLRAGRERVAGAARDPREIEALALAAGVEGWRRRLIGIAAREDPTSILLYFSLVEVLNLGWTPAPPSVDLNGWGVPQRVLDGSLEVRLALRLDAQRMASRANEAPMLARLADIELRVVEWLDALKLPSALAPGVMAFAAWDVTTGAGMADRDDWLAVARAAQSLPLDRVRDCVSALTAHGPMVPVGERRK